MNRKTKMFLATGLYLGFIGYFGGCEAWYLLLGGELNEFGDFLAGVFTPVAFLWLIYGYLLQHEELEETRKTLSTQVEVLQGQADADRRRSTPNLSLELTGINPGPVFTLRNIGGPARNLTAEVEGTAHPFTLPSLDTVEECQPPIFSPPSDHLYYTACFTSELHERLYQRWRIQFTAPPLTALPHIEQITNGPTLLTDGQSPPLVEE